MSEQQSNIESAMQEHRLFPPSPSFGANAQHQEPRRAYDKIYRESIDNPENSGAKRLPSCTGSKMGQGAGLERPNAKWFVGGKTNLATTASIARSKPAAATKPPSSGKASPKPARRAAAERFSKITYQQLTDDVCQFANGLKKLGVKKGDRVTIYMPMVPEAAVAMLACARIGAAALGHLRRILQPGDRRSRRGCARAISSSPPTADFGAERSCR